MRIISGTLGGRKLSLPKGVDARPTTDRVKESLFSTIQARKGLDGATVLDLFCGGGGLTFEALSRGCAHSTMVDSDSKICSHVKSLSKELGVQDRTQVLNMPTETYLKGAPKKFDIIFCDPPYKWPYAHKVLETVLEKEWLNEEGWFVLEHDMRQLYTDHPHCVFSKPYGSTMISIFLNRKIHEI